MLKLHAHSDSIAHSSLLSVSLLFCLCVARACAHSLSFRLTVTVWCPACIMQGQCTYAEPSYFPSDLIVCGFACILQESYTFPELHTHSDLIAHSGLMMLHWPSSS